MCPDTASFTFTPILYLKIHTIPQGVSSVFVEMRCTKMELKFNEFYNNWISHLEHLHYELLQASSANSSINKKYYNLQTLISKATAHFKEYYKAKWIAAHEDVLAFYAPTQWLTPLENAHFWFTGFKPTMIFKLIDKLKQKPEATSALTELTQVQMKAIGEIKMRVRNEEDKVESDMERLQVSVADWKMVKLAKMTSHVMYDHSDLGRKVNGMSQQVAINSIVSGLEKVMKAGDCVRLKAMKSVLDVLTLNQSVEFLAAIAIVHVQLRKKGLQLMSQNGPKSSTDKS